MPASPDTAGNAKPPAQAEAEFPVGPITRLIEEIGKAATAGWAETARLILLMVVAAAAITIIIAATR